MADTSKAHTAAEKHVVQHVLPELFGQTFSPAKLKLTWGGYFAYDGVSADHSIIVCVSTSEGVTSSGNYATAKVMKLAKDVLMMLHTPVAQLRVLALTEKSMLEAVERMQALGRFPPPSEIKAIHTPLMPELQRDVEAVRVHARAEVTPSTNLKASQ